MSLAIIAIIRIIAKANNYYLYLTFPGTPMTISEISKQAVIPRSAPTLLALLIGAAAAGVAMPLAAETSASAPQPGASGSKDTITVIAKPEDNFRSGGDELVPAYLTAKSPMADGWGFWGSKTRATCRLTSSAIPIR